MLPVQLVWGHLRQLATYPQPHVVMYSILNVLPSGLAMSNVVVLNAENRVKRVKLLNFTSQKMIKQIVTLANWKQKILN